MRLRYLAASLVACLAQHSLADNATSTQFEKEPPVCKTGEEVQNGKCVPRQRVHAASGATKDEDSGKGAAKSAVVAPDTAKKPEK